MGQSTAMVLFGGLIIVWMVIVGIVTGITGSIGFMGYHLTIGGTFGTLISISTNYAIYILALAGAFIVSGLISAKFFLIFLIAFELMALAYVFGLI